MGVGGDDYLALTLLGKREQKPGDQIEPARMDTVFGFLQRQEGSAPWVKGDGAERENSERSFRQDTGGILHSSLSDQQIQGAASFIQLDT